MAELYTLAFDCDQDEVAARRIASTFVGFEVDLTEIELGKLDCRVERYWARKRPVHLFEDPDDWLIVCIEFVRLQSQTEIELHAPEVLQTIQDEIYDQVKQVSGYRAAMFGCEAQDDLGDEDWLTALEETLSGQHPRKYWDLILQESLTTGSRIEPNVNDFAPGYVCYEAKGSITLGRS